MKKILAITLALAVLLCLCACGGGGSDDPNAGMYQGVSATVSGFTLPMADVYPGETWVELETGGKGTVNLGGQEFSMKWYLSGNEITITISGEDSVGSLENGVITIDFMDMGCLMVFEKSAEAGIAETSSEVAQTDTQASSEVPAAAAVDAALLGLYEGSSYEFAGQVYDMSVLYNTPSTVELMDGGKGVLVMDGQSHDFIWTLEGESFNLNMDNVDSPGTLKDAVISIDLNGVGMLMNFEKAG